MYCMSVLFYQLLNRNVAANKRGSYGILINRAREIVLEFTPCIIDIHFNYCTLLTEA